MIKAIIFDVDGVLVDATDWHYNALNRALEVFAYGISRSEHVAFFNGLPTRVKLEILSQTAGLPRSLHSFIGTLKQKFTLEEVGSKCTRDEIAVALLESLKREGYKLGVCSNAVRETVEVVLEKKGIRGLFDVILSNEDVKACKPDPEIYLACAEELDVQPFDCLVVEDAIPGIQAAYAAGMEVAICRNPKEVDFQFVKRHVKRCNAVGRDGTQSANSRESCIEIVVPMAGLGTRFKNAGYKVPKTLIDVSGKPMIQRVIDNVTPKRHKYHFTFLCNAEHIRRYSLDSELSKYAPHCTVVPVPGTTLGAAATVLLAIDAIDSSMPLLVVNSDQLVEASIDAFLSDAENRQLDGLIMTFPASETRWSYAKVGEDDLVSAVAEKDPISARATAGIYFFSSGNEFIASCQEMIQKDIRTNNEFYVCPVYNELIQRGKRVGVYDIGRGQMHGLGTPEELEAFLRRSRDFGLAGC